VLVKKKVTEGGYRPQAEKSRAEVGFSDARSAAPVSIEKCSVITKIMVMSLLTSARREAFAAAVATGMSASRAYSFAYGRPRSGATRASAARLLTNANVRRRIAELRLEGAREAGASLQLLLPELEQRARAAMAAGRLREAARTLERLASIASFAEQR